MRRLTYDPALGFSAAIREELILGGFLRGTPPQDLSTLHEHLPPECLRFVDAADFTPLTKHFFDVLEGGRGPLCEAYRRFLERVVKPGLELDRIVYQRMPAVRFIFPDQPSMIPGKDEYGSFHADVFNGHPPAEVNLWVPCTPCFGSNSLQVLDDEQSKEALDLFELEWRMKHGSSSFQECMHVPELHVKMYRLIARRWAHLAHALDGREGDAFLFSPLLVHGTLRNRTNRTRVSVDLRAMRPDDYERLPREYRSLSGQRAYTVGDLYDVG